MIERLLISGADHGLGADQTDFATGSADGSADECHCSVCCIEMCSRQQEKRIRKTKW